MTDEAAWREIAERLGPARAAELFQLRAATASEDADDDLGWLQDLALAASDVPLPPVPPMLSQDLAQIFRDGPPPPPQIARAELDTRFEHQAAGVRGSTTDPGAWSARYSCSAAEILMRVADREDGNAMVSGQVLLYEKDLLFRVHLTAGSVYVDYAETDELGQFEFPNVERGPHSLLLSGGELAIDLSLDLTASAS